MCLCCDSVFIKKLAYASTGIATHHGLATIGIENTHRKVGFGNGTTVDKHKAVGANALVAVAPGDSGRDGVGDGMFHRVYVDVVIATTMHLSERNLVCHVFCRGQSYCSISKVRRFRRGICQPWLLSVYHWPWHGLRGRRRWQSHHRQKRS